MALTSGTKLGSYEIRQLLGAGALGEVYRAFDPKLRRAVALKVLPASFSSDQQRMGRFEREAQVLAALNHPNIAAVYGLETSQSIRRASGSSSQIRTRTTLFYSESIPTLADSRPRSLCLRHMHRFA